METYRHTQVGKLMLVLGVPLLVWAVVVFFWADYPTNIIAAGILLVTGSLLVLGFGWMTVTVRDGEVLIRPGVGLIRKRYKLSEFIELRPVYNRWWYGWGVRWWPGTVLFTVSGLRAVELRRLNDTCVRIGTDEPDALIEALRKGREIGRSYCCP